MKDSDLRKLLKDAVVMRPLPPELRARLQETLEEASTSGLLEDVPAALEIPPHLRRTLKGQLKAGKQRKAMTRTAQMFAVAAALVVFATVGYGVVANLGNGPSKVIGLGTPTIRTPSSPTRRPATHPTVPKTQPPKPNPTAFTASTGKPDPGQTFAASPPVKGLALSGPTGSCGASSASQQHDVGWVKITRKPAGTDPASASPAAEPSPAAASTETEVTVSVHLDTAMPAPKYMVWLVQLDGFDCIGNRDLGAISTEGAAPFDGDFDASVASGMTYQVILTEDGMGVVSDSAFVTKPQVFTID